MQTKIKPLPGYCLIEPIEDEQKSAGGVYLPESTKDKPSKGRVVDIGFLKWTLEVFDTKLEISASKELYKELKSKVKKGQIVIFKKWVSQEVQHEGKEYLLVKFDELLAVVE